MWQPSNVHIVHSCLRIRPLSSFRLLGSWQEHLEPGWVLVEANASGEIFARYAKVDSIIPLYHPATYLLSHHQYARHNVVIILQNQNLGEVSMLRFACYCTSNYAENPFVIVLLLTFLNITLLVVIPVAAFSNVKAVHLDCKLSAWCAWKRAKCKIWSKLVQ